MCRGVEASGMSGALEKISTAKTGRYVEIVEAAVKCTGLWFTVGLG